MKPVHIIAVCAIAALSAGAFAISTSFLGNAEESKTAEAPSETPAPASKADAEATDETKPSKPESEGDDADAPEDSADSDDTKEEDKPMTDKTAEKPEDTDAFKQQMHEGDVALGVCGARVSTLLWFYEASVAQGRDDLKDAVESLTASRETIKSEAERRAVEDKVDTSVRVMNDESQRMWDELNEKAGGDTEEFQKAHDELLSGVQECLSLFFERPGNADGEKTEEKSE